MQAVRLGIVGCGTVANDYYASTLEKFPQLLDDLCLVDTNRSAAKALASRLNHGQIFEEYRDITNKVDGVIVTVPHSLHYKVATYFLNAGIHVLCEKPLAETANEVQQLNEAAVQNNVALCVNNTRRLYPSLKRTKEMIATHQFGDLVSIDFYEGHRFDSPSSTGFYVNPEASSKGVVLDIGAHVMDSVCWWLSEKPQLSFNKDDSFGGPESVSLITASAGQCKIRLFLNRLFDLESRFDVKGESGSVHGKLSELRRISVTDRSGAVVVENIKSDIKSYEDCFVPLISNFVNVITSRERPLISGEDVINSIGMIEDYYRQRTRFSMPWYASPRISLGDTDKVLVTGATGFVGGRVVEVLHMNNNDVRAGIRRWSSAARVGRFPVKFQKFDLMYKNEISRALDGVNEIVHCAIGPKGVTEEGTRNLLDVGLSKGIRRFVHLSTAEVYGHASGTVDESTPFAYTGDDYNKSKIEAEKICWDYIEQGAPVTILRPSIVYGPFSRVWIVQFAKAIIARELFAYGESRGTCNLVYVDDLVRAIVAVLKQETAIGEAFNINGREVVTWNEYFQRFNEALGFPPIEETSKMHLKSRAVMKGALSFASRTLGPLKQAAERFERGRMLMSFLKKLESNSPSDSDLEVYRRSAIYSGEKARRLLGFEATYSLDQGLRNSVEWLRNQGFLGLA